MRVLVVDDEKPCLDDLVYILSKQKDIEIVGAFTSSMKAMEASAGLEFDAAFLDLCMPHLNGADLAVEMLARSPELKVVFVTAYKKELAKLGDSSSAGSLLKPVSEVKLREVLQRLQC